MAVAVSSSVSTRVSSASGRPAMAYAFARGDFQRRAVRYVRALDSLGSQWPPPVEVDSVPDNSIFFTDLNLEVFDGVPSLLFARNTNSGSPAVEQPS